MSGGIIKHWNGSAFAEFYPKTTTGQIVAGGTPSSSTFLRGDGNWASPAYAHTHTGEDITDASPVYYIAGNTGGTAGTWTGTHAGISSYYDGLTVAYKIGTAGASTTTLNINSIGAVTCRFNTSNLTTHYAVNNVIILVYTTISSVGYWVKADYTDNTNNSQLWTYGPIAGDAITQYKIVMEGTDGKYYPLSIGDTTAATKTVATTQFKLGGYILWSYTSASYAANATMNNYTTYTHMAGSVFNYTTNQSTFTLNMPVYLVGTIQSNGSFVLNNTTLTSWMTQTLPTTDDGFVYILLGMKVSSTANTYLTLTPEHTIYQYKNSALRIYEAPQSWSEITSKPTTFAPIIGSGAADAVAGNDSRLTNARTPTAHNLIDTTGHSVSGLTTGHFLKATGATTYAFGAHGLTATDVGARGSTWVPSWSEVTSKPTTFAPIIGSGAADAVAGNDSRLTNARTPTAHNFIDTTGHPVSGLTTGHFLKALSATTYGFGAHGLTYSDVGAAESGHNHSGVYEPVITKLTAFNKNYGTTDADVKMNGTQAVGSVDAIARIDHVHPVDTSRAPATHSHGNIDASGNLNGTQITAASGDYIPLADVSNSNKLGYSNIALGTSAFTFLRNDGTWQNPMLTSILTGEALVYDTSYVNTGLSLSLAANATYLVRMVGAWKRIAGSAAHTYRLSLISSATSLTGAYASGKFEFSSLATTTAETVATFYSITATPGGTYNTMVTASATTTVIQAPIVFDAVIHTPTSYAMTITLQHSTSASIVNGSGLDAGALLYAIRIN